MDVGAGMYVTVVVGWVSVGLCHCDVCWCGEVVVVIELF